ncbi:hypothetical protein [Saccharopolyspora phatthalungensis]|uniref:Uncharacterized protein n=1 Tax=Saccharopolyspora phatthalungensis TaxID=664693 RepID=A0A840QAB1_9PSEU|nr:hypothetical protein [Saccharopolyspora phatthalungensis]MBB5153763.1 hypothetical protein [Saccharopolyspora phatthalungensis]
MAENTELELLITVVVGADDEQSAHAACRDLVQRIGGRIVASGDCSDEEPGCWSVTISRASAETGQHVAGLSRAVRNFLRELGPGYARHRVSCEPPTAWTVVEHPDLVGDLVVGGERLLVEAWAGGSILFGRSDVSDPDEPPLEIAPGIGDFDEDGMPRPRLRLRVDVVTERRAGAEWPARAVASRLSRTATITGYAVDPPLVQVAMDLGPALGDPPEIMLGAVAALGGSGWSRLRVDEHHAVARWSAAPLPPSGIAAIEISAIDPEADEPDNTDSTVDSAGSG